MDENAFRFAKLIGYKSLADVAGKASTLVITVVAARQLTANAFGVFSLASTVGWMLAVAADCGIQLHVARAVSRAPDDAGPLLAGWLRVRLWTTAAAIALLAAATVASRSAASLAVPLVLFACVYGASGLVEFLYYFYRGLSRSDIESSLTILQRAGTVACGVAALLWRPDVTVLAAAMLVPAAATLVGTLRIARRFTAGSPERRVAGPQPSDHPSADPATPRIFLTQVLPIGAGIVLSALYFRIDVFLVELWSGTAAVGLYNAVFRLIEALRLFPAAALAVALPSLCRATDLRPLARVSAGVTAFAAIGSIVLWSSAGWLVPLLYGNRYLDAVPAFRILSLAFPLFSLNYALTHQLIGWDGQRAYAAICATALAGNVAMNARLIPALSIDGAAWATLGTEGIVTAGCLAAIAASTRRSPAVPALEASA
ncbi:MAG TPA: oligosaccharide flippase family protein [Vicinamibacterales bacterium]|nr:oligosaccharide flippase family protein [Vicinamibacterales bacterium]